MLCVLYMALGSSKPCPETVPFSRMPYCKGVTTPMLIWAFYQKLVGADMPTAYGQILLTADLSGLSFAHSFYAVCEDFNSHVAIQKSWAIFQKYNYKQMSTFSRYTFKDTFPNITVLTWCIVGALDWMCRVSFSTQSFFFLSRGEATGKETKKLILASIWPNGSTAKPSETWSVHQLKGKTMLFAKQS